MLVTFHAIWHVITELLRTYCQKEEHINHSDVDNSFLANKL